MADAAHALHRLADTHRADHTRENTVPPAPVTTPARAPVGEDNRAERPAPSLLPVEETPEEGGPRRRNRSAVYALLIAAALLLVLGGIAYAAAQRGDTPSAAGTAGGRSTASGSDTHSSSPARKITPATKNSPARQSSAGAPHTASGPAQATGGGASAKEAFVRDYYATAPGGTDAAWAMLGPGEQDQGRGAYDGFWRTIRSVDVLSARARPGSDSVDVTLTYHTTDGRLSTERKREGLIRSSGGGYLLNSDVAAG
jgi:hypothetical protein